MALIIYCKKPKKKKCIINKEKFFLACSALVGAGFSSQIIYILMKSRYDRFFMKSSNAKLVNLNLKISRSKFKKANDSAVLTGFYRAM